MTHERPASPSPGLVRAAAEALVICVAAALIGLAVNGVRRRPITVGGPIPTAPESCMAPAVEHAKPVPFIDQSLAAKRHGQRGVLFIDARPRREFAVSHIAGAIDIPADDPLSDEARMRAVKEAELVVVYCDRPECGLSTRLGQRLRAAGVSDVRVLAKGWHAWYTAGYPAQSGGF